MAGEKYEGEGSSMTVVCNAQVKNLKHISEMIEAVDQRQLAAGVKGQKNNTSHRTTRKYSIYSNTGIEICICIEICMYLYQYWNRNF